VRVGIGTRYAAYVSLLTLALVTLALVAAGTLAFRRATVLQGEIQGAIAEAQSTEADAALRATTSYLSNRLFNALLQLDVERLDEEIRQVRTWLPVTSFLVTDAERRVLTDGTDSKKRYGELFPETLPVAEPWLRLLRRPDRSTDVRFAIRSGDVVAGWAVVTLTEDRLSASLRRLNEGTERLWTGYRSSMLYLGAVVLVVTVLLGVLTGGRLSRTLARPLTDMSRAAAQFAAGDLGHAVAVSSRDELGELATALNSMARDLQANETALRSERDLVSRLMETSPVGIVRTDVAGRFLFANPQAERILRLARGDGEANAYREPAWRMTREDGEPLADAEQPFALVVRDRCPVFGLRRAIVWPDGWTLFVSINAAPLLGAAGALDGVVATVEDITERRSRELERERLITDLERKNAELERFTYTVSHDLKSPLVTILGFAGVVEADVKAGVLDRVHDGLSRIVAAGHKMHRLLEDLLELSRIGRIVEISADVPLEDVAHEAVELVQARLDEKGAVVEISPDLPIVRGDRQRLREVFQNLIENAAKFSTKEGIPRIEIGVRSVGVERVVYVRDNGEGIEARFLERVFDLFEKLNARAEGTGVGLTLVRRIVEAHGGRVWAESEGQGRGATFCLTLPQRAEA
jgi:PAS domain S-box-containing protein